MEDMEAQHYAFVALLGCGLAVLAGMFSADLNAGMTAPRQARAGCISTVGLSEKEIGELGVAVATSSAHSGGRIQPCADQMTEAEAVRAAIDQAVITAAGAMAGVEPNLRSSDDPRSVPGSVDARPVFAD